MSKPQLSTHVLDTSSGQPGTGVPVSVYELKPEGWALLHEGATSADGRLAVPACSTGTFPAGTYKLRFDTGTYYSALKVHSLYPFVEIAFTTKENEHYHIPLLISPFGYSTYRGS